ADRAGAVRVGLEKGERDAGREEGPRRGRPLRETALGDGIRLSRKAIDAEYAQEERVPAAVRSHFDADGRGRQGAGSDVAEEVPAVVDVLRTVRRAEGHRRGAVDGQRVDDGV